MRTQTQIPQKAFSADSGFIHSYQQLVRKTVIPYQYSVLCDEAEGAEKSHVVQNFINAAKALKGEDSGDGFYGMVFQDSDAAKWLEACAYSLALFPDGELERTADRLIEKIADAQDQDGYLNTRFTICDRDKRWTNLLEAHELYCAGHMMEAACAYYEATGKDRLLNVMLKNAEHIYKIFITDGHEGFPGHPEVELALLKMYKTTGSKHCLELAEHFINVRGTDPDYYKKESLRRDWSVWGNDPGDGVYQQSAVPVRKLDTAGGHAVRAVYLYTAMADLAVETDDKELLEACERLWESITLRQMYVTGAIGSTACGEAFSVDYDLPNDTAYAETCASIGLMFFASKMLENTVDGKYADVMEQAFYNTVLAGIALDGKSFFYVNPLECVPGISGVTAIRFHTLTQRPGWYACACCPPNAARLISSLGKYAYGENPDVAFCHMFVQGTVSFSNGLTVRCETEYPYGFDIRYRIGGSGRLAVRIPGWSKKTSLSVNGTQREIVLDRGYAYLKVSDGDEILIRLDKAPRFVYASSRVPGLSGRACICRGPLVYCFEGVDNNGDVLSLSLKSGGTVSVLDKENELGGAVRLSADAFRITQQDRDGHSPLYSSVPPLKEACSAIAVPYYTWCNRGENQMRVWLPVE